MFWLLSESCYDKMRKIEGCDGQGDLRATVTDNEHIIAIADNLGIPPENRYINISPSLKDLKESHV